MLHNNVVPRFSMVPVVVDSMTCFDDDDVDDVDDEALP